MNYTFKENQLDYETYYILRKSVKWNNWSREQAEIALVNSYYTVTVFDNKVPIGMGRAVKPEYQRMGIGSTIIHMLLEHIEKNMCVGSRVSVQLISEPDKEQFYIKQGFKLIPHEYCGPALRKVIYKKG